MASADADGLFELMTASVISQLDLIRAGRLAAAAAAGWRAYVKHRRAQRERAECAFEMAHWSRLHAHFYAMLAHQQVRDAERCGKGREFRRLGLLQSVFIAWGPLFKLRQAERIGEADRCMRRAVLRCRLRASLDR